MFERKILEMTREECPIFSAPSDVSFCDGRTFFLLPNRKHRNMSETRTYGALASFVRVAVERKKKCWTTAPHDYNSGAP
jgi:hypothetical protein